jgi:hypothetical protein
MSVDNFESSIPTEDLIRLTAIGQRYGFEPLSSTEMESYFTRLLQKFTVDEIEAEIVPQSFISLKAVPQWLQGAEWPLHDDEPLIFLGQLEVPSNSYILGVTAVYVFCVRRSGQLQFITQRDGI